MGIYTKKAHRFDVLSCGGPTRTGDLQVMSLASYQLLHPAILRIKLEVNIAAVSRLRVQRYAFSPTLPNVLVKNCKIIVYMAEKAYLCAEITLYTNIVWR